MKKLICSLLLAGVCTLASAQGDLDALRYSQTDLNGTARSLAVGGAFGALGADFSSATINPAGFALYRSNSFNLSGGMTNTKSNVEYLGNTKKDFDFNLSLPSIGLVFYNGKYQDRKPARKGWINTNFSIGVVKTNNFNGIKNYNGSNNTNSMLDYFAERANGLTVDNLSATSEELETGYYDLETMAWDAYLIDSVGPRTYGASIDPLNRSLNQKNIINSTGGTNNISLHLSSNYENKFYVGGGVNIITVRYKEQNRFTETDESSNFNNWSVWSLEQNILTKGFGVNANLGFIVRPNDNVRFGAAIQTPTFYDLRDEYSDELSVDYDDGSFGEFKTADGYYEYELLTPLKTTMSAAYLFGKSGFISTDIEVVDYSTMRLRPSISAFEASNDLIAGKYGNAVNVKVGGEYVMNILRLRGGFARYASPLSNPKDGNLSRYFATAGVGIKDTKWALDLALVQQMGKEINQPYTLDGSTVPASINKGKRNSVVISLSTKF